jgi:hypothetical protein
MTFSLCSLIGIKASTACAPDDQYPSHEITSVRPSRSGCAGGLAVEFPKTSPRDLLFDHVVELSACKAREVTAGGLMPSSRTMACPRLTPSNAHNVLRPLVGRNHLAGGLLPLHGRYEWRENMKLTTLVIATGLLMGQVGFALAQGGGGGGGSSGGSGGGTGSGGSTGSAGSTSPGSAGGPSGSPGSAGALGSAPGIAPPGSPSAAPGLNAPSPADGTTSGRAPGVNPGNSQDLSQRSNPQDLTRQGGSNPQDARPIAPNIPNIAVPERR